ncbi:low molecular weight protein-tyrosine-phosphatase [Tenacibaculum geojense]|uniref:protein-tyrosine-phosphatase n=1 Tax=Tenacibaculum geojense TaxID=915352 RepID=A0ABW3JP38_9FLAO
MKILMVCLGNICRSPLAQGILEAKVDSKTITVDSAGTSGHHEGELPDVRSIKIAKDYGLDITNQRSRKFTIADFDKFDLIYTMDDSNYHNVLQLCRTKNDAAKVKMILNETHPGKNLNVPDPYYGGEQGFENVYKMLEEACEIIASKINTP